MVVVDYLVVKFSKNILLFTWYKSKRVWWMMYILRSSTQLGMGVPRNARDNCLLNSRVWCLVRCSSSRLLKSNHPKIEPPKKKSPGGGERGGGAVEWYQTRPCEWSHCFDLRSGSGGHAYIHENMNTRLDAYTHACIHTYTHTHPHAHTQK